MVMAIRTIRILTIPCEFFLMVIGMAIGAHIVLERSGQTDLMTALTIYGIMFSNQLKTSFVMIKGADSLYIVK